MSMKFQTISLPDKKPRDAAQLKKKIPLYRGLTAYYFFGVFALIFPFIPAIALALNGMISKIGWIPLLFLFMITETFAFLILNFANRNYLRRLRALSNGIAIKAKVIGQSRNFVILKGGKNYSLTVSYEFKQRKMEEKFDAAFAELHSNFPVNSEICGLFDPESESVFFPPEIGLVLEEKPVISNPRGQQLKK
jgi:hypothetical protein